MLFRSALLRAVCDEFWLVTQASIQPFEGDLDDYQRFLLDEAKRLKTAAAASGLSPMNTSVPAAPNSSNQNNASLLKKLQKKMDVIEAQIQQLEAQRDQLHQLLSSTVSGNELAQHARSLKQLEQQLPELEAQWLSLSEQMDVGEVSK